MIKYYQNSNSHIMERMLHLNLMYHCYFSSYVRMWDGLINYFFNVCHKKPAHMAKSSEAHLSTHSVLEGSAYKYLLCHVHLIYYSASEAGHQSQATCIDLPLNSWLVHKQYDYELQAASRTIFIPWCDGFKKFISFQPKYFYLFFFSLQETEPFSTALQY